jgi:hypothetical protein
MAAAAAADEAASNPSAGGRGWPTLGSLRRRLVRRSSADGGASGGGVGGVAAVVARVMPYGRASSLTAQQQQQQQQQQAGRGGKGSGGPGAQPPPTQRRSSGAGGGRAPGRRRGEPPSDGGTGRRWGERSAAFDAAGWWGVHEALNRAGLLEDLKLSLEMFVTRAFDALRWLVRRVTLSLKPAAGAAAGGGGAGGASVRAAAGREPRPARRPVPVGSPDRVQPPAPLQLRGRRRRDAGDDGAASGDGADAPPPALSGALKHARSGSGGVQREGSGSASSPSARLGRMESWQRLSLDRRGPGGGDGGSEEDEDDLQEEWRQQEQQRGRQQRRPGSPPEAQRPAQQSWREWLGRAPAPASPRGAPGSDGAGDGDGGLPTRPAISLKLGMRSKSFGSGVVSWVSVCGCVRIPYDWLGLEGAILSLHPQNLCFPSRPRPPPRRTPSRVSPTPAAR